MAPCVLLVVRGSVRAGGATCVLVVVVARGSVSGGGSGGGTWLRACCGEYLSPSETDLT